MVLLEDTGGSGKGWLAQNNDLEVDTVPPYVLNVESSKRNGEEIRTPFVQKGAMS